MARIVIRKTASVNSEVVNAVFNSLDDLMISANKAAIKYHSEDNHLTDFATRDLDIWNSGKGLSNKDVLHRAQTGDALYFNKYFKELANVNAEGELVMFNNDFEGMYVDVDAYLQGLPEVFINETRVSAAPKFIDIEINICASWKVSNEDISQKLIKVIELTNSLEMNNCRVRLIASTYGDRSVTLMDKDIPAEINTQVVIKDYHETIPLERIAFLVGSPVLFRYFFLLDNANYATDIHNGHYASSDKRENDCVYSNKENYIYIPSFYYDTRNGITIGANSIASYYPHLEKFVA